MSIMMPDLVQFVLCFKIPDSTKPTTRVCAVRLVMSIIKKIMMSEVKRRVSAAAEENLAPLSSDSTDCHSVRLFSHSVPSRPSSAAAVYCYSSITITVCSCLQVKTSKQVTFACEEKLHRLTILKRFVRTNLFKVFKVSLKVLRPV